MDDAKAGRPTVPYASIIPIERSERAGDGGKALATAILLSFPPFPPPLLLLRALRVAVGDSGSLDCEALSESTPDADSEEEEEEEEGENNAAAPSFKFPTPIIAAAAAGVAEAMVMASPPAAAAAAAFAAAA